VHDITNLENRGLPGVFVASSEFTEAAKAQSLALGFETAVIFVPHPIQDRTDAEMNALADNALDAILQMVMQDNHG